ncbi:MAG TPA: hypothetical protein VN966_03700 [Candidatus Bathyarchaeia archaeon]|nr:hypothetical protein [Candidatus Bathyarchaeia archaeon]
MASEVPINDSIPLHVDYFHAASLGETRNIFRTDVGSVEITPRQNYDAFDIVDKIIRPLKEKGILKQDGNTLLVPLEGLLVVPDPVGTTRFPLVMIGHGNHAAYFNHADTKPVASQKGNLAFSILAHPVLSYTGYQSFQHELAKNGIASYSINLNIVNDLDNNETTAFKKMAIDFSQRMLLFFLNLKLLRVFAGEPITLPAGGGDDFPIKFLTGTTFVNLTDALANPTIDPRLRPLRDALQGRIDFTRLGFMGHSRGADAVSRIPAYFFNGTASPNPTFPHNQVVNNRIRSLSEQLGSPRQEIIKCILALEPVAALDLTTPPANQHGYVIDNNQTMYFIGLGTHDEDVTLDPVRIYEFPGCPKVMIAINGATHKRFNSVWAGHEHADEFGTEKLKLNLLSKKQHESILHGVFGSCFTGTLGGNPLSLLPFTKKTQFVTDLPTSIDFQGAWKFGFPFPIAANSLLTLDGKVTSTPQESIKGQGYAFEQDLKAFFVEKNNEGTVTIRIPIDPNTGEKLSNFNHFSFRFAKGFDVSSNATRVEEKNFTIQFFENDTPVGKSVTGPDIKTLELRALQAFDATDNTSAEPEFEYSILMQTAEITLSEHLSDTELPRITRIDINVIPDVTKSPPNSTAKVVFGTIGGAVLGGAVGVGGAALYNAILEPAEGKRKKILIGSGIVGTIVVGGTALYILKAGKHAFVFKDFLLTNRQIPVVATP